MDFCYHGGCTSDVRVPVLLADDDRVSDGQARVFCVTDRRSEALLQSILHWI